jgi:hypothetical protein
LSTAANKQQRSHGVQDAQYFRTQAQLYFELARRMSARTDAEYCRVTAERYVTAADDLEKHSVSGTPIIDEAQWGEFVMTTPADFRQYALDCMREAECADHGATRLTMCGLARLWMGLALEMDQRAMLARDERRARDDTPPSGANHPMAHHDEAVN